MGFSVLVFLVAEVVVVDLRRWTRLHSSRPRDKTLKKQS